VTAKAAASPRSSKIGSHIPDRWPYWLAKVEDDPAWKRVTIGGLVKAAKESSVEDVSTAFGWAIELRDKIDNPMGWIRTTARAIHGAPE
jgi:hypothetical protein